MCYGSMEDDAGGFGKGLADGVAPASVAAGGLLSMQTEESLECEPLPLTYVIPVASCVATLCLHCLIP